MPRIRKKSSNRQNTRDRAKITKKVKEHKRKSKKAAKKDVTWKSNKKKDTVIPNSFPFKDQVLAEQAEEKRLADEARLAQRTRKSVIEEEDAPGIGAVNTGVLTATTSLPNLKAPIATAEDDIPELVDTSLANLQDCLDKADVVLQVVDARDISGCRNKWVEKMVTDAKGKFGLIINKADLVPREVLESWLPHLPENSFVFKSSLSVGNVPSSSKTQLPHNPEQCLGKEELLEAFAGWSKQLAGKKVGKTSSDPLVIALFGLPNVGKTSVLNSLLGKLHGKYATAPVVPMATGAKALGPTTARPTEVPLTLDGGVKVHVIDTPGWEPVQDDEIDEEEEDEDEEGEMSEETMAKYEKLESDLAGDMLRRNMGRIDKIKDAFPLANYIISRSNPQDLMLAYNVPYFTPGDIEGFLTLLARAGARLKKHGDADLESAARLLLRDWAHNSFPYYCIPPKAAPNASMASVSAHAEKVLERLRGKKEMRILGRGLVRFKGGEVDEREVILDDDYTAALAPSDSDEEEEEEDEEDEDEEDEDEDEDEEVGSDEDVPILIGSDAGEELDLEDGPEPSSGSDVEDEEEDNEEEEEEVPPPKLKGKLKRKLTLAQSPDGKAAKRARSGTVSAVPAEKAKTNKRVSFGKDVVLNAKEIEAQKAFKGLGKRRR